MPPAGCVARSTNKAAIGSTTIYPPTPIPGGPVGAHHSDGEDRRGSTVKAAIDGVTHSFRWVRTGGTESLTIPMVRGSTTIYPPTPIPGAR